MAPKAALRSWITLHTEQTSGNSTQTFQKGFLGLSKRRFGDTAPNQNSISATAIASMTPNAVGKPTAIYMAAAHEWL
jgi:hypothetical protein